MADDSLRITQLQPYQSVVLAEVRPAATLGGLLERCLADVKQVLRLEETNAEPEEGERVRILEAEDPHSESDAESLVHAFLHYRLSKPVTWTSSREIRDEENHLVMFTRKLGTRLVAIYASEKSRRRAIRRKFGAADTDGLRYFEEIEPERMNDAFFGETVRTLWMSGMHRRVPVKADAKVLSGQDLEFALDPLDDQTFYFSAARSELSALNAAVGLSPKKSRIWRGPSSNWDQYRRAVDEVLVRLDEAPNREEPPLPVLARTASSAENIGDAYDMVIQPPELAPTDGGYSEERLQAIDDWAYNGDFEVESAGDGLDLTVVVGRNGEEVGELSIAIGAEDPDDATIQEVEIADQAEENTEIDEQMEEIRDLCGETSRLKVYYDTGHTLSNGSLFEVRFRDQPFRGWNWQTFSGDYDVSKEKPDDFPDPNLNDPWDDQGDWSLFKWVFDAWRAGSLPWSSDTAEGWLASDDGAGEIADFIHFVPAGDRPEISLIHVKAAGSTSPNRQISVSKYEVVTAQAVKNIRNLDHEALGEGLYAGISKMVGKYVWHDGQEADRGDMCGELRDVDRRPELRVIVVQPHIRKSFYQQVRGDDASSNATRLRQLDLILNQAEQACHGVGAEFTVMSAG